MRSRFGDLWEWGDGHALFQIGGARYALKECPQYLYNGGPWKVKDMHRHVLKGPHIYAPLFSYLTVILNRRIK
jgi:hypothetical protein